MGPKRNNWTAEAMSAAVNEVKFGGSSVRRAAAKYNVPKSSLGDRVSGRVPEGAMNGKAPLLERADEEFLINTATQRSQMGVGFSKQNFKRAAAALAKKRGVSFKGRGDIPSEKWWVLFKRRNGGVSLRQPEGTAGVRHKLMRPERVSSYFNVLRDELTRQNLIDKPKCLWNMDETAINLSSDSVKVVSRKGSKNIQAKCGSRENVTMIACGNAAGTMMPPHFIVKGKTKQAIKSWDTDMAPNGSIISVSDSGWIKQGLSSLWFSEVFMKNVGAHRPQILIFDGHDSHHHIELIELARANNIILMEMPSHCSQWLQPLDRAVFGPLKNFWKETTTTFLAETGCPVTHAYFFRLVTRAWGRMKPDYLINGFRATGIHPCDPSAIPKEAFVPSSVYTGTMEGKGDDGTQSGIDETGQPDTVMNISELPQEGTIVDRGISISDSGVVMSSGPFDASLDKDLAVICDTIAQDPLPIASSADACPPELALAVIECSLCNVQKDQYEKALSAGRDLIGDRTFQTWRTTCTQPSEDPWLLQTPSVSLPATKKATDGPKGGYFVISCDMAFKEKKDAEMKKAIKLEQKKGSREKHPNYNTAYPENNKMIK